MLIGTERLLGEVVELERQTATLQVYEETAGLASGAPVFATGQPFAVELGPGLMGGVFDGVQRLLPRLAEAQGNFLGRGQHTTALDRDRLWDFAPSVRTGDFVRGGSVLGTVQETRRSSIGCSSLRAVSGRVADVAAPGPHRVADIVATLAGDDGSRTGLTLFHTLARASAAAGARAAAAEHADADWATRARHLLPAAAGRRVWDAWRIWNRQDHHAATALQMGRSRRHRLCGLRRTRQRDDRNVVEAAEPRRSAQRPPAGRAHDAQSRTRRTCRCRRARPQFTRASTIAEYYRDMGYQVALLADSTSRWAEALREISGRLGEMPAEEGYPPYLASRLASYYERAGRVRTLGGSEGSVTLISAISPPGGDLTEPVTRHTQRFTQCFWTLDKALAEARMFPAVSLRESYSHLPNELVAWWTAATMPDWPQLQTGRARAAR